jgi:hypothetical protein
MHSRASLIVASLAFAEFVLIGLVGLVLGFLLMQLALLALVVLGLSLI